MGHPSGRPFGAYDRGESADQEQSGRRMFPLLFGRLDRLNAAIPVHLASGSRMDTDNHLSNPYALSNHLDQLLAVATDHLGATRLFLEGVGGVPAFALYSVLRSAIEASCAGLWLLLHSKQKTRTERLLSFTWANRQDAEGFARRFGKGAPTKLESVRASLNEVKGRQKSLQQFDFEAKRLTSTTDMMIEVQKKLKTEPTLTALVAWSLCSGVAHANSYTIIATHERRQIDEGDELGARYELTSSMSTLAMVFESALFYTETLVAEYQAAAKPPGR